MVIACMPKTQVPARFYGSALPRPRFFTDPKFNLERVDPPVPVMDAFLSWAHDAHWSMGGLSFDRYRLQGRIEGSIKKLMAQQEDRVRTPTSTKPKKPKIPKISRVLEETPLPESFESDSSDSKSEKEIADSPLPAGSTYRRKRGKGFDPSPQRTKRARKLGDVFDRIAAEQQMGSAISSRTRSSGNLSEAPPVEEDEVNEVEVKASPPARRISPRKKV